MAKYNLIEEINKILSELDNIDIKDPKAILSWFYKAIYFNNMYEDKAISSSILDRLKEAGFEEKVSEEDYYNNIRTLLVESDSVDEDKIMQSLLSAIIRKLELSEPLDENLNSFLRIYNERFNKIITNAIMMNLLRECIGENIVYVCIKDGTFSLKNGVIDSVDDYISINVNGEKIPFIGFNIGIKTIYASDGKYLYNNPHLTKDSDLVEFYSLETLKKKTFGKAYDDSKLIKL